MKRPYLAPLLFLAAFACFAVAWLLAINFIFHDGNEPAWIAGGFALLTAGLAVRTAP